MLVTIFDAQDGYTPLHLSCISGHRSTAKTLFESGASLDKRTRVSTVRWWW